MTSAALRAAALLLGLGTASSGAAPIQINLQVDGFRTTRFGGIVDRLAIQFTADDAMPDEEPGNTIGLYRFLPYSLQYGSHSESGIGHIQVRDIPNGPDQFLISLPFHPPFGDISYMSLGLYDPTGQMFTSDSLSMPSGFASSADYMRYFFWLPWRESTTPFEFSSDSLAAQFSSYVGPALIPGPAPLSGPTPAALLLPAIALAWRMGRRR